MKITLKEIIGQFLNSSDQSSHEFLRLWNIGVFGLKTEFNLDITGTFKTAILDVNPNSTVTLPCDYIKYSKIGVVNGQGEVVTFKRNNQLSTLDTGGQSRLVGAPIGGGVDYSPFPYDGLYYNNYYYDGVTYNLYGSNSGTANIGEYKVDEGQGLIFLDPRTSHSKIVLEYLSDGFDGSCGDYAIDVRAAETMIAYLRWKDAIDSRKKFPMNVVVEFKKEFYRNKRLTKMRTNPFVLNELEHSMRVSTKLVPKS